MPQSRRGRRENESVNPCVAGEARETAPGERQRASGARPLVLLAEADRRLRRQLRSALSKDHRVIEATTAQEAIAQAAAHNPDLAVLALALPGADGIGLTSKLRKWTLAPILIVSSHGDEAGKVAALDAGANDYVTTPLRTGEVLARVRVWLRATRRVHASSLRTELEVGNLRIDFLQQRAYVVGREVRLTPKQYRLFAMMMRNAGKVLSREVLLTSVWGPAYASETQYLRVYIGHLRQKFEEDPSRPQYFLTEPGVGYRLRRDEGELSELPAQSA